MARNSKVTKKKSRDRRPASGAASGRPRRGRPKVCAFCRDRAIWVDYKDVALLKRFVNDRGRIKARGATGTCAQHQRDVATAVKTARELALLPYAVRTVSTESRGGRGRDRRGNGSAPPTGDASAPAAPALSDEAAGSAPDEASARPVTTPA
ncbi:MAG: 30S ribosomal protein S18 [Acidimicrobiaceae bacterium]|nr:30S ribosomal protein S18 [Acidimicrobiaceae bacterium]